MLTATVSSISETNAIFTWGRCTVKPSCASMAVANVSHPENRERLYRMRSNRLLPIEIWITMSPYYIRTCLIHDERRRFCDLLLRYSVIYFDVDLILARLQACQWQALLNRDLVRIRIRLRRQLLCLQDGLVGCQIQDLVLNRRAVLFTLFVDTKVIHLHPKVQTLRPMKSHRRRNAARYPRNNMSVTNNEVSCPDVPRWHALHLSGQNQRGRR